jgi:hypothetical protein
MICSPSASPASWSWEIESAVSRAPGMASTCTGAAAMSEGPASTGDKWLSAGAKPGIWPAPASGDTSLAESSVPASGRIWFAGFRSGTRPSKDRDAAKTPRRLPKNTTFRSALRMPTIPSCRSRSSSTDNSNQRSSGAVCTKNSADIGNFRRFARDGGRADVQSGVALHVQPALLLLHFKCNLGHAAGRLAAKVLAASGRVALAQGLLMCLVDRG